MLPLYLLFVIFQYLKHSILLLKINRACLIWAWLLLWFFWKNTKALGIILLLDLGSFLVRQDQFVKVLVEQKRWQIFAFKWNTLLKKKKNVGQGLGSIYWLLTGRKHIWMRVYCQKVWSSFFFCAATFQSHEYSEQLWCY